MELLSAGLPELDLERPDETAEFVREWQPDLIVNAAAYTAVDKVAPTPRGEPGGVYCLTGRGSTTWHDFAAFIFTESKRLGGPAPMLEAISSADYKTAARRPLNSRLDCTAFHHRFGVSLRPWKEAVSETVSRYLSLSGAAQSST